MAGKARFILPIIVTTIRALPVAHGIAWRIIALIDGVA